MLPSDNELTLIARPCAMEEILGIEINIIFVHNTIANLFRIVEAVVATVNQKRQLLVVILNKFVIIGKV